MTLTLGTARVTAVGALARREALRMVRHPVYPLVLVCLVLVSGIDVANLGIPSRGMVRSGVEAIGLMFFGLVTFVVANLVASSARRARADSQLDAAPTTAQVRTLAACLGVLGPTAVATGLAAALWLVEHAGTTVDRAQGPAELAAIPVCTLSAGLLGVAVARWLPWPGAAVVVVVALVSWAFAVSEVRTLWWTTPWTMSPNFYDNIGLYAGSQVWHAVYLLGLGLLAAVAALLRYPSHRRPLLALGAGVWIGTLFACWVQLP